MRQGYEQRGQLAITLDVSVSGSIGAAFEHKMKMDYILDSRYYICTYIKQSALCRMCHTAERRRMACAVNADQSKQLNFTRWDI